VLIGVFAAASVHQDPNQDSRTRPRRRQIHLGLRLLAGEMGRAGAPQACRFFILALFALVNRRTRRRLRWALWFVIA